MELHPQIAPLSFLLGTWQGEGEGRYPTIADFAYGEEVVFTHVGKPFLAYRQRTWALDDQRPLHAEAGYLRRTAEGALEWVLVHPTGVAEIELGELDGTKLRLSTSHVVATPTAKPVEALTRELVIDGDTLRYELHMAAVGQELGFHLAATLHRVAGAP